jgi:hypothetical protein
LRTWCGARCSCSRYSRCPGVEPGSWHLRFRSASVRAHLTGWMWMGHLAPFKLAQGGTAPGGGCYWESRPSCRTRSLKYLPEQMCVDEITLTSAAAAAAAAAAASAVAAAAGSGQDEAAANSPATTPRGKRKRKKKASDPNAARRLHKARRTESKYTKQA